MGVYVETYVDERLSGIAPLGFTREPILKGNLIIDPTDTGIMVINWHNESATESGIKITLSGGTNRKALCSHVFVKAPRAGRQTNVCISLIEDLIGLSKRFLMLRRSELKRIEGGKRRIAA